jgi:hypothetical protein
VQERVSSSGFVAFKISSSNPGLFQRVVAPDSFQSTHAPNSRAFATFADEGVAIMIMEMDRWYS